MLLASGPTIAVHFSARQSSLSVTTVGFPRTPPVLGISIRKMPLPVRFISALTLRQNCPEVSAACQLSAVKRLATDAIPEDLRKYLKAEIEAGITHNLNQSGVAAEMLDRLVD